MSGKREKPFSLDMSFSDALKRFAQVDPKEANPVDDTDQPLPLIEDTETGNRFLIYATESGIRVDLQVDGETFWAAEQQIADMFGVTRQNINLHLRNVFKEGELNEDSVCKESLRTGRDGKRYPTKLYDLNALISVGYRVGGKHGTLFRIWATDKLFRYLTKGFVIDTPRLKSAGEHDRVSELREIIRDIRAAEANVYAELRRICALCQDYDPKSEDAHRFYSHMQAKLFWAVTSHTPSEIVNSRANASHPNMGLQTWPQENIRQSDATVAKNYLTDAEIKELNRLTTILLDIFDDQLNIGKLTMMKQASVLLDQQLRQLNRAVLTSGGRVSHQDAEMRAKSHYKAFDDARRAERANAQLRELAALKAAGKTISKPKG